MAKRYTYSEKKRKAVYGKFCGRCAYCGCYITYNEMVIDHIVSFYDGGGNNNENLFPSCHDCNNRKTYLTLEEFRENLKFLQFENYPKLNVLRKYYKITPKQENFLFYFETFNKGE